MTTSDDSLRSSAPGGKTARSGDVRTPRKSRAPQTARYEEMRDRRRRERSEAKRQTRHALLEAGLDEIIERGLDADLDGIALPIRRSKLFCSAGQRSIARGP